MKSGKGSGMISHEMLAELFRRLAHEFRDLPAALSELWWTVGLPGVICLAMAAVLGVVILRIKRLFFMTAAELHREALTLLGDPKHQGRNLREVERLLRRAVQQQNYIPARTSLAALYTYRLGRHDDALKLLSSSPSSSCPPLSQDEKGIQLDARAIKAGNEHMILVELQMLEFLSLAYADGVGPSLLEEPASALSSPTECKKKR
jgi:hypothetical protein